MHAIVAIINFVIAMFYVACVNKVTCTCAELNNAHTLYIICTLATITVWGQLWCLVQVHVHVTL